MNLNERSRSATSRRRSSLQIRTHRVSVGSTEYQWNKPMMINRRSVLY